MTTLAARAIAPFRPLPTPTDPGRLGAMQDARQRSGIVWLVAGVASAHLAGLQWPALAYGMVGWVWIALIGLVAVAMLTAGFAQLALLARAEPRRIPTATTAGALAVVGVLLAPAAGFLWIAFGMVHVLLPVAVGALGVALLALDPSMRAGMPRPAAGTLIGTVSAALLLGLGVLDAFVLLPMSLAPDVPLPAILAQLRAAGEDGGMWTPLAWAGMWLIAIALLGMGLLRNRRSQRGALGTLLAAGVVALFALPIVEFSIGMGVADTLATQGGMSTAFPAISLLAALLAALAAGLLIGARQR
ncbi:hypothetical protein [Agrococcus beijingensis]|uniref:hypothetical protein n=1 Tax=Agrococcus beijingensis TaxID=3068634 RepID=UPI0027428C87|nr:hypothetical protein [Agrococcus sp. REN33]